MFVADGGVCGVALLMSLLVARVRDRRVCASISGRNRSRRETLRTASPVDHLGLIDLVIRVVGGGQARGHTDRAVDVVRRAVGPTRYRPQHSQALSRDLDTVFAKGAGCVDGRLHGYDGIMYPVLDSVKNL